MAAIVLQSPIRHGNGAPKNIVHRKKIVFYCRSNPWLVSRSARISTAQRKKPRRFQQCLQYVSESSGRISVHNLSNLFRHVQCMCRATFACVGALDILINRVWSIDWMAGLFLKKGEIWENNFLPSDFITSRSAHSSIFDMLCHLAATDTLCGSISKQRSCLQIFATLQVSVFDPQYLFIAISLCSNPTTGCVVDLGIWYRTRNSLFPCSNTKKGDFLLHQLTLWLTTLKIKSHYFMHICSFQFNCEICISGEKTRWHAVLFTLCPDCQLDECAISFALRSGRPLLSRRRQSARSVRILQGYKQRL